MEKKMWIAPQMEGMQFMAGEYCESACGTNNVIYNFTCDAGASTSRGDVWIDTNENGTLDSSDQQISSADAMYIPFYGYQWNGGYHACGEAHQASATDDFYKGFYQEYSLDRSEGMSEVGGLQSVIIWRGPNNDNTHCTTNLDMNSWTTAKS